MVQAETRRLAAIMFTDIVGFSRQMGADEARMLRLLTVHNQIIQQAVTEHHGTVIKTVGDAFLVDFPSVVHAVQCAQQIQSLFRAHNAEKEQAERIPVYALLSEPRRGLRQTLQVQRLKLSRRVGTAHLARAALIVVGLLIGGGLVALLYPSIILTPPSALRNQEA